MKVGDIRLLVHRLEFSVDEASLTGRQSGLLDSSDSGRLGGLPTRKTSQCVARRRLRLPGSASSVGTRCSGGRVGDSTSRLCSAGGTLSQPVS